jgi:hypothetical protein
MSGKIINTEPTSAHKNMPVYCCMNSMESYMFLPPIVTIFRKVFFEVYVTYNSSSSSSFLYGLSCLAYSGIDALSSFPGASIISSSSRLVIEGVLRESGVVHSFKMVDPILFAFWCSRPVFEKFLVLSL